MEFWEANGTSGPSVVEITAPTTLASYNSVIRYSQTQSYHGLLRLAELTNKTVQCSLSPGRPDLFVFICIYWSWTARQHLAGWPRPLSDWAVFTSIWKLLPPSLNTHQAPGQNFCSTVKTSKQKLGEINFCWNHQVSFILNYKISERRKIKAFTRISSQPDGRGPHLEKSYS